MRASRPAERPSWQMFLASRGYVVGHHACCKVSMMSELVLPPPPPHAYGRIGTPAIFQQASQAADIHRWSSHAATTWTLPYHNMRGSACQTCMRCTTWTAQSSPGQASRARHSGTWISWAPGCTCWLAWACRSSFPRSSRAQRCCACGLTAFLTARCAACPPACVMWHQANFKRTKPSQGALQRCTALCNRQRAILRDLSYLSYALGP